MTDQKRPLFDPVDIPAAIGLLSRLPVRVNPQKAADRGAASAWAWPVAGLAVALVAAAAGWVALAVGLNAQLAAVAVLAAQALVTGALHEDGLSDTADGLWGASTPEGRLAIMQDSRIGAFGALTLMLATLATLVVLACLGLGPGVRAVLFVAVAAGTVAILAQRKIGGQTGDVLGAVQQVSEIAVLAAIAGAFAT